MEHKILFVMKSPGWPLVHTLGGQGRGRCGHHNTRLWVLGTLQYNTSGVIPGKPSSP